MTGKDIEGYLVQTTPDGAVEIRIAEAVVRAISVEAMSGFGVTRRRGAEVGGLLLGSVKKGVFSVEDCEIVPCEYAYGPSYLLSDNDAPKFAETVLRNRAAPGVSRYAVGWFRSHTRDGLQPDAPDFELFHRHFPGSSAALLLIKPYASRPPDAAVFLPQGGRLASEPALEFGLAVAPAAPQPAVSAKAEPAQLAAAAPRVAPEPDPPPPPPVAPEPVPPPDPPQPKPVVLPRIPTERERLLAEVLGPVDQTNGGAPRAATDRELFTDYAPKPASRFWHILAWTVFTISALLFGFAAGYREAGGNLAAAMPWSDPIPVKDPFSIGLSARARAGSILIQWDRYSAAARSAQRGVATITSSNGREQIELSSAELQSGVLLYKANVDDATIRLEVFITPDRLIAEQTVWRRSATMEQ